MTNDAPASRDPISDAAKLRWNSYLASVPFTRLQPECHPQRYPFQGDKKDFKGSVVLFHGFTACPQQFWELGPKLAAKGFEVYVPLLPGHGRQKNNNDGSLVPDLDALPKHEDSSDYSKLGDSMTDMVRFNEGARVVAGISVGGTLATYSFFDSRSTTIWTRALILAPMYVTFEKANGPIDMLSKLPLLNKIDFGWGSECEEESSIKNNADRGGRFFRGGYCKFHVDHLGSISALGDKSLRAIQNLATMRGRIETPHAIQIVAVDFDAGTRKASLEEAARLLSENAAKGEAKQAFRSTFAGCSYASGVPHSFLSRYDDHSTRKYWLGSFFADAVNFVAEGKPFRTEGNSAALEGYGKCVINESENPRVPGFVPPWPLQAPDAAKASAEYPVL